MPKLVTEKYPDGSPKVTVEGVDGHTITETLAKPPPPNQLIERKDSYSDSSGPTTKTSSYNPPGTLEKTVTEHTKANGDEVIQEDDAAGKPVKKTEKQERPLPAPKNGTRTTTTDYVWDPVAKKWKKKHEKTVTQETGADGKKLPEESSEIDYDDAGKPKKKTDIKLDKDGKGKVTGRTTTTSTYEDGKPKTDDGKKEKYDPESGTFKMMSVSLTVHFIEEGPARPARASGRSERRSLRA